MQFWRYSRLQICATMERFMGVLSSFRPAHGPWTKTRATSSPTLRIFDKAGDKVAGKVEGGFVLVFSGGEANLWASFRNFIFFVTLRIFGDGFF
jgi:hypothetical protein